MEITVQYIEQKFEEFNHLMFDGKLRRIPVQLSKARTFLGQCVYKKRRTLWGKVENYDFRLKISTVITLSEPEIEDIIIHEMIHYYIGVNHLRDTSAHGERFRRMMNDINARFGRNITVSHRNTKEQREEAMAKIKVKARVVALVSFHDGRIGVKVLPMVKESIRRYCNAVLSSREVKNIRLYVSKNTYFGQYPSSSALRVHYVAQDEIAKQLMDANTLTL